MHSNFQVLKQILNQTEVYLKHSGSRKPSLNLRVFALLEGEPLPQYQASCKLGQFFF